jgi:DNA replication and repair protein RecF
VARLGEAVTAERLQYLEGVTPHIRAVLEELTPGLAVEIKYHRGWGADESLGKLLGDSSPREVKYASTLWGPHRADVHLRVEGTPAGAVLSRGQGKLVASAMQIAQASLLAEAEHRSTVFLIDDAGAELDVAHNERFFALLQRIGGQILATTTRYPTSQDLQMLDPGETKMFHVEHGEVEPSNEHSDRNISGAEQETQ